MVGGSALLDVLVNVGHTHTNISKFIVVCRRDSLIRLDVLLAYLTLRLYPCLFCHYYTKKIQVKLNEYTYIGFYKIISKKNIVVLYG